MEHERYGKHSLQDGEDGVVPMPTRDMSPANWIPFNPLPVTADRQTALRAPAKKIDGTDADRRGLVGFVRELLT